MSTLQKGGSLRERFEEFVTTLAGFESIDGLLKDNHLSGKQRADYLLAERSIIIEQKVLEKDPSNRPQEFMMRLIKERKYIAYGTIGSNVLFSKMPDGEKQKARMFNHLTQPLQKSIHKADKQTRDTREIFGIPDAMGVVVLLNENAKTLTPDIVRWGLTRSIAATPDATVFKYSNNTGFIVLSDLHAIPSTGSEQLRPICPFVHPEGRDPERFQDFSDAFSKHWASFNGAPQRVRQIRRCQRFGVGF